MGSSSSATNRAPPGPCGPCCILHRRCQRAASRAFSHPTCPRTVAFAHAVQSPWQRVASVLILAEHDRDHLGARRDGRQVDDAERDIRSQGLAKDADGLGARLVRQILSPPAHGHKHNSQPGRVSAAEGWPSAAATAAARTGTGAISCDCDVAIDDDDDDDAGVTVSARGVTKLKRRIASRSSGPTCQPRRGARGRHRSARRLGQLQPCAHRASMGGPCPPRSLFMGSRRRSQYLRHMLGSVGEPVMLEQRSCGGSFGDLLLKGLQQKVVEFLFGDGAPTSSLTLTARWSAVLVRGGRRPASPVRVRTGEALAGSGGCSSWMQRTIAPYTE